MKFTNEVFRTVGTVDYKLVHESSKREIPMLIRYIDNHNSEGFHTSHFIKFSETETIPCDVSFHKGRKCLNIKSTFVKKNKEEIAKILGIEESVIKNGNVSIVVTEESYDLFHSFSDKSFLPFKEKADLVRKEKQEKEDSQIRVYRIYSFLDMGDYSTNYEREVKEYRIDEASKEIFVKKIASFWNSAFKNHEDWKEDWAKDIEGNHNNYNEIISLELKEKWEERYQIHLKEKENEKSEAEKKKSDKREKEKAERKKKFDQAAETGERVFLGDIFVSGDQVPKTYQNQYEDNDMGHIQWWALPNGEVEETFSPSY